MQGHNNKKIMQFIFISFTIHAEPPSNKNNHFSGMISGYHIFLVTHPTFSACLDAIYSQVQCDWFYLLWLSDLSLVWIFFAAQKKPRWWLISRCLFLYAHSNWLEKDIYWTWPMQCYIFTFTRNAKMYNIHNTDNSTNAFLLWEAASSPSWQFFSHFTCGYA
jgi:hypothetical protein